MGNNESNIDLIASLTDLNNIFAHLQMTPMSPELFSDFPYLDTEGFFFYLTLKKCKKLLNTEPKCSQP